MSEGKELDNSRVTSASAFVHKSSVVVNGRGVIPVRYAGKNKRTRMRIESINYSNWRETGEKIVIKKYKEGDQDSVVDFGMFRKIAWQQGGKI